MEEKRGGRDYAAARKEEEGSGDSLDGADQADLVYALDGSGLDAEGLGGEDAGTVRATAPLAAIVVVTQR